MPKHTYCSTYSYNKATDSTRSNNIIFFEDARTIWTHGKMFGAAASWSSESGGSISLTVGNTSKTLSLSSHTHNYAAASHTHGSITQYETHRNNDSQVINPSSLPAGLHVRFRNSTGAGSNNSWNTILSVNAYSGSSGSGAGYRHEFLFSDSGDHRSTGDFWIRHGVDSNWGSWHKVLTSGNSSLSGSTVKINGTSATFSLSNHNHSGVYAPASHSHSYLPLSGGTLTGLLTVKYSDSHSGIKIGDTYITAIGGSVIFQNNTAIRFGTDDWDFNKWAGLKYEASTKCVYLGLADGTVFVANAAQSGGTLLLPGISRIRVGATSASNGTLVSLAGHKHDSVYLKKSGGVLTGKIEFNKWGCYCNIGNGDVDDTPSLGGSLTNLVISSWYGISFTTSCANCTYTGTTAVGIDCRRGYLVANKVTADTIVKSGGTSAQILLADGSVIAKSSFAAASHSHNYLPLSGGTLTGRLNTCGKGGSWITGKSDAAIRFNNLTAIDSVSAWFLYNMKSEGGHVLTFGGYGNDIGFYGYLSSRTENGFDYSLVCNTSTGVWKFSHTPTVNGTELAKKSDLNDISTLLNKINGVVV